MKRTVTARIRAQTRAATSMVFSVAVARDAGYLGLEESLRVSVDGAQADLAEVPDFHGGVLHTLRVEAPSTVELDYHAVVSGQGVMPSASDGDLIRYVRPSRYCESDRLLPTSYAEFGGMQGVELLEAVRQWVGSELQYVSGSSRPTDGAVETLLARRGVCRDYAHLVISLLRAKDVPARLASVYAPGLRPMDFHAVAEAWVDGQWHILDATGLAPRASMLRIATGRDASDTAFLSTVGGSLALNVLEVTAVVDELPVDRSGQSVQLR
ncbi:transglutaminase family protein [Arthrobacter sp. H5]|uniref:transglutaminase-like domain-containing protein n=1 Tax=Arthrobacter sp. H5 TaxID=1267973 RepID=UPI00048586FE|nr:transglutaminase family protein [Arthrobacter sp. H5]